MLSARFWYQVFFFLKMLIRQTWTTIFSSTFWRLIKRTDCVIKRIDHGFRRHLNVWKQCLYKNLTSNNFRRTAVLKKYDSELSTKASVLRFYWKKLGALHALEDVEPHFKFSKNYRQIYGKSKASLWRNLRTGTPPIFFGIILCFVALVYNLYIFFRTAVSRKLFDIRLSYKHFNFSRVCLLVKMASKTMTRSHKVYTWRGGGGYCHI